MHSPLIYKKILIIGKSNVGKSSLFNALGKRRNALISSYQGTTRDFLSYSLVYHPQSSQKETQLILTFIDSGGFWWDENPSIYHIEDNMESHFKKVDLILWILEWDNTKEDLVYLDKARIEYKDKIMTVINKVDSTERWSQACNFYAYALPLLNFISIKNRQGLDKLKENIFHYFSLQISEWTLAPSSLSHLVHTLKEKEVLSLLNHDNHGQDIETSPKKSKDLIKIAILGRPNVGKSTLINRLMPQEISLTSEVEGTTCDLVHGSFFWEKHHFACVDTAGLRRKNKIKLTLEKYSSYKTLEAIQQCDLVWLLLDPHQGLVEQDKKILHQVLKLGKGLILVVNKIDLLLINNESELSRLKDKIYHQFPQIKFAPLLTISALKQSNRLENLLKNSIKIYQQLHHKVATSYLNQHLQRWNFSYIRLGTSGPIKYLTQTGINPVQFKAFSHSKQAVREDYRQYLINKIQKLVFKNVAIQLKIHYNQK